jgi:hypothetical protein
VNREVQDDRYFVDPFITPFTIIHMFPHVQVPCIIRFRAEIIIFFTDFKLLSHKGITAMESLV